MLDRTTLTVDREYSGDGQSYVCSSRKMTRGIQRLPLNRARFSALLQVYDCGTLGTSVSCRFTREESIAQLEALSPKEDVSHFSELMATQ